MDKPSCLSYLDIFTYVPKPQGFQISSTKSKIATFCLILTYLGYVVYQIYYYIELQSPFISNYILDTQPSQVSFPNVAYGYYYQQNNNLLNLNDPSYFNILFEQVLVDNREITTIQTSQVINQIHNCNNSWIDSLPKIYKNLTCLEGNNQLYVYYFQLIFKMHQHNLNIMLFKDQQCYCAIL